MSRVPALLALIAAPLLTALMAADWDAPDLTDPQVAHVAVTANTIDVQLARLALQRASNPEVKQFAETMISDHTSVNLQAAALAEKLGVAPEDNDVSRSLLKDAAQARQKLEKLSAEAFDWAYIERELAYHEAVIDAVTNVLIPATENPQLKQLLESALPAFDAHLTHARMVRESLDQT